MRQYPGSLSSSPDCVLQSLQSFSMNIAVHGSHLPGVSETVRFRHRGNTSRGDSSCVANLAEGGSSAHFNTSLWPRRDTAYLKALKSVGSLLAHKGKRREDFGRYFPTASSIVADGNDCGWRFNTLELARTMSSSESSEIGSLNNSYVCVCRVLGFEEVMRLYRDRFDI